jgi:hypothetical protein
MKVFRRRTWWIVFVTLAVIVPFVAVWVDQLNAETKSEESAEWFERMATVMLSPRCINCHTVEDYPAQGEDHHKHANDVIRPASQRRSVSNEFGKGADAAPCIDCHASVNMADGRQPGAPNWRQPPASMGWDRMTSAAELCHHVLNKEFNAGRTPEDLVEHMTTDPLVQYAFDPGTGRKKPPLTQREFHQAVRNWVATGASCPDDPITGQSGGTSN